MLVLKALDPWEPFSPGEKMVQLVTLDMAEPQWTNPHSLSCQEVCSRCVASAPDKMTRGQLTGHLPVVTPPHVERYVFLGPG